MSRNQTCSWVVLLGILVLALGLGLQAEPVQAQATTPAPDEPACLNCHEDLYYLHDTGNHYCITAASSRCADCHGGNPDAVTKDLAHLGRTAHPIINGDFSLCESCHPGDGGAHVERFSALAGFSPTVVVALQAPGSGEPVQAADQEREFGKQAAIATGLLGLVLAGLLALCFLTNRSCHG